MAFIDMERRLPYEPVFLIAPGTSPAKVANFRSETVRVPFLHPAEQIEIPRLLKKVGADLYHSPSFSSLLVSPCPWMVTVHDLNHLTFGGVKQRLYYNLLLRRFARQAKAVLTVSEFSKKEIADWTGLHPRAIDVVYNALDPALAESAPNAELDEAVARYGLTRGRYFLCMSNPKPHKNTELLRRAYGDFRRELVQEQGEAAAWPLVLSFHTGAGEPGVLEAGPLDERDARLLLEGAGALVFPSLYEGFGLPPLEGACKGVPLVVSKIEPHLEGLEDLEHDEVLWVDPIDQRAWTVALKEACLGRLKRPSPESRAKLMERFSFSQFGQVMDRIYRRVLGV
jgi:glycosyltransferase involved in cell wall biosynthesis